MNNKWDDDDGSGVEGSAWNGLSDALTLFL